ncbi:lysine--tRNA ligase [Tanacetum coccineum]
MLLHLLNTLAAKKEARINPFPYEFHPTISILEFRKEYEHLEKGKHLEGEQTCVAGDSELDEDEFFKFYDSVKIGDIVGIVGFPGEGGAEYFPKSVHCFNPCLQQLPIPKAKSVAAVDNALTQGRGRNPDACILKDLVVYGAMLLADVQQAVEKECAAKDWLYEDREDETKGVAKWLHRHGM